MACAAPAVPIGSDDWYWDQDGCSHMEDLLRESQLHWTDECAALASDPTVRSALQALHELAHPHGRIGIEDCREEPCIRLAPPPPLSALTLGKAG